MFRMESNTIINANVFLLYNLQTKPNQYIDKKVI